MSEYHIAEDGGCRKTYWLPFLLHKIRAHWFCGIHSDCDRNYYCSDDR